MILENILDEKRRIICEEKKIVPLEKLRKKPAEPNPRSLKKSLEEKGFGIIAELKRGSPSAGVIDRNLDVTGKALAYSRSGVSGISVLTCEPYFYGSPDDLRDVRKVIDLPLLMKDFIFDPYQVFQGKACGADAVLLILRVLSDDGFNRLSDTAESLMMEVLVEVHTRDELERTFRLVKNWKDKILGINNRNLETLKTDLNVTLDLIKFVPRDKITVISESGIKNRSEVKMLEEAGLHGILVGESILRSDNLKEKLKELIK